MIFVNLSPESNELYMLGDFNIKGVGGGGSRGQKTCLAHMKVLIELNINAFYGIKKSFFVLTKSYI